MAHNHRATGHLIFETATGCAIDHQSLALSLSFLTGCRFRLLFGQERYECIGIDSFHTGSAILFRPNQVTRGSRCRTRRFTQLGSYGSGQAPPGSRWGWRTEIEQPYDDHLVITMTNISPDGEEAKAVEVQYTRKPTA